MVTTKPIRKTSLRRKCRQSKYLLLLALPGIVYYFLFHYAPMYGVIIAFKNYKGGASMMQAPWVGLKWFEEFFGSIYFGRLLRNTLLISLYNLVFGFPLPILFALVLHETQNRMFKRVVQTVSYLPHFISVVVVVGMLQTMLSTTDGVVNNLIRAGGGNVINFFGSNQWFRPLYVGSGIWQSFGWNSIIYLAALTNADPTLYEAARIDGANRWQRMRHVTWPGLVPVVAMMLLLRVGNILSAGYEQILVMYNPAVYSVADIIQTYVYRIGLGQMDFSTGTAMGMFESVVGFALVVAANAVSRRFFERSLW